MAVSCRLAAKQPRPIRESEVSVPAFLLLLLNLELTVLVHDFLPLTPSVREDTRRHLSSVLGSASIDLVWIECRVGTSLLNKARCDVPGRGDVLLRFIDRGNVKSGGADLEILGFTEPDWAGRGLITMWPARVDEMRRGTHWQFPALLAHAIAHEVGHLLGLGEHAHAGLMSTNWTKSRLRRTMPYGLAFSTSDIAAMQDALLRRLTPRRTAAAAPPDRQ
jgi:hypothetical protein